MSSIGCARTPGIKQKRYRTGCRTCRARKKKCDEAKPSCMTCERTGYVCTYSIFRDPGYQPEKTIRRSTCPRYQRTDTTYCRSMGAAEESQSLPRPLSRTPDCEIAGVSSTNEDNDTSITSSTASRTAQSTAVPTYWQLIREALSIYPNGLDSAAVAAWIHDHHADMFPDRNPSVTAASVASALSSAAQRGKLWRWRGPDGERAFVYTLPDDETTSGDRSAGNVVAEQGTTSGRSASTCTVPLKTATEISIATPRVGSTSRGVVSMNKSTPATARMTSCDQNVHDAQMVQPSMTYPSNSPLRPSDSIEEGEVAMLIDLGQRVRHAQQLHNRAKDNVARKHRLIAQSEEAYSEAQIAEQGLQNLSTRISDLEAELITLRDAQIAARHECAAKHDRLKAITKERDQTEQQQQDFAHQMDSMRRDLQLDWPA